MHRLLKFALAVFIPTPCSKVRVFRFSTGKLSRTYDESLAAANELQRSGSGGQRNAPRRAHLPASP